MRLAIASLAFVVASIGLSLVDVGNLVAADALVVTTISSRPDMVSGGDALVEIRSTSGSSSVVVTVNDSDASGIFKPHAERKSLVGLVKGLRVGRNVITVKSGSQSARLEVTNHPITGPIVSGDHIAPFVCRTVESGLGEPLD